MAKRFRIKMYKDKVKADGTKAYEVEAATRARVLEVLNDRTNTPDEFKNVPTNFNYFDHILAKDKESYRWFVVRTSTGTKVGPKTTAFVKDILAPGWNEKVEKAFRVSEYKPYGRRTKAQKFVVRLVEELVSTSDEKARSVKASKILEALQTAFV